MWDDVFHILFILSFMHFTIGVLLKCFALISVVVYKHLVQG